MRKKILSVFLIFLICICSFNISCFATTDEVKLFISGDFGTDTYAVQATTYAANTFDNLGYDIRKTSLIFNYAVTSSRDTVMNYIQESGNNYAFYVFAHAGPGVFAMQNGVASSYIYSSDITGGWHLVFINGCSSMADQSFANAFHTIGYDNRASLGWYLDVTNVASAEWWGYFYEAAGSMGLRDACLEAASHCSNSTPIRIFGDTSWYGFAWT